MSNLDLDIVNAMLAGARRVLKARFIEFEKASLAKAGHRITGPLKANVKITLSVVTALKNEQEKLRTDARTAP